jgi:hypothetical protein
MIEKRLPLKIPPGIVYTGTYQERMGRWLDGNFIRFTDSGEAVALQDATAITFVGTPPSGGQCRAAFSWFNSNTGVFAFLNQNIVVGKASKMYRFNNLSRTVLDITPSSGVGTLGAYDTWAFANQGDVLLFSKAYGSDSAGSGGLLWQWDPAVGGIATTVSGAPTTVRGVTVTPEAFVMVIAGDRTIQWASQGTRTTWTPSGVNSAGDIDVPTGGQLMRLVTVRGETLALGDTDAWAIDYVGGDLYYGSRKVGDNCGLHGPNTAVVMGNTLYWMGHRGFYKYDGFVQRVECPVANTIFEFWNDGASGRCFGVAVPQHNEIWWFYNSGGGANGPTKCVRYNPATGMWYMEPLVRSAGVDGVWPAQSGGGNNLTVPVLFDQNGDIGYEHGAESTVMPGAFLESGAFALDDGDQTMLVQKIMVDGANGPENFTLYGQDVSAEFAPETSVALSLAYGAATDVRLRARFVRVKAEITNVFTRIGVITLGITPSARR